MKPLSQKDLKHAIQVAKGLGAEYKYVFPWEKKLEEMKEKK